MIKFPIDIYPKITREMGKKVWKIVSILLILREEVEAREASEGSIIFPPGHPFEGSSNPTTSSLVAKFNTLCVL